MYLGLIWVVGHDVDIELEGDGALHIHADAPIIPYLQAYEIYVGLTPKE
jgi:hypothetical protein